MYGQHSLKLDGRRYDVAETFLLRRPLLPVSALFDADEGGPVDLAARSILDIAETSMLDRLRRLCGRSDVREALYLASGDFAALVDEWRRSDDSEHTAGVPVGVFKYMSRLCARATPFGVFAGHAIGTVAVKTNLRVTSASELSTATTLDGAYLVSVCEFLRDTDTTRASLRFHPNSTIYAFAGQLRYARFTQAGTIRIYHLAAVEDFAELQATITAARDGRTLRDLGEILTFEDTSPDDVSTFLEELVNAQILVPVIEPGVTGEEPFRRLLSDLQGVDAASGLVAELSSIRSRLDALDATPLGSRSGRATLEAIVENIRTLPVPTPKHLFHSILFDGGPPVATIGREVLDVVGEGLTALHRLRAMGAPLADGGTGDWGEFATFRQRFLDRYGNIEMPLTEVLDEENGIGWSARPEEDDNPTPLLETIRFPGTPEGTSMSPRHPALLRLVCNAIQAGEREIILRPADLEELATPNHRPLARAFSTSITVIAKDDAAIAENDFRVLIQGYSGASGTSYIGRFGNADKRVHSMAAAQVGREAGMARDQVLAEIVHLPQGRDINVVSRPVLREYEIVYGGSAGTPTSRQLHISDLLVSVDGIRVVLRSQRLGKQIIPRLSNAHNPFSGRQLPIYVFLSRLQFQEETHLLWHWRGFEDFPYLPRVCVGRAILEPARWKLAPADLHDIASTQREFRAKAVEQFRQQRKVPRFVRIGGDDNQLLLDLDESLCVDTLVQLSRRGGETVLVEAIEMQEGLCAQGSDGRYVHEMIVPFASHEANSVTKGLSKRTLSLASARAKPFIPGSEWLYLKLYTGLATADRLLKTVIADFIAELRSRSLIDRWYFVRYRDPDFHLRIRLHGNANELRELVLPLSGQYLSTSIASSAIARIQCDTYEPEINRYGGGAVMAKAMGFFETDSDAIIDTLRISSELGAEDKRWVFGACGIGAILEGCGYDDAGANRLLLDLRAGYGRYPTVGRTERFLRNSLSARYRVLRSDLEMALNGVPEWEPLARVKAVFGKREAALSSFVNAARAGEADGTLTDSFDSIVGSIVHMHANRLFRTSHAKQELVLYDFLAQIYRSRVARSASALSGKQKRDPNEGKVRVERN
jgi:thiopeptide-type bacteriocin biosynthesis protein